MPERTTVLVPGLTCDATIWAAQLEPLGAFAPVVIPRLHDDRTLDVMAARILSEISTPLHVIGHSMGGRVALSMVRQAPERVVSLVLLDTGAHPAGADEPQQRQVRLDIATNDGMEALAADWVPNMVHPDRRDDRDLIDAITAMVTSYSVEQYEGQIHALLNRHDERDTLAAITCPTLVACGSHDSWSPPEQHETIAAAISGARLEIIADAGHMVSMERPDALTDLVVGWLDEIG